MVAKLLPPLHLQCDLSFDAGGRIKGKVQRLSGPGLDKVCSLEGRWDDKVYARSKALGAQGLVFDAGVTAPGVQRAVPSINLRKLGPRHMPLLWTVLHDTLVSIDPRKDASGTHARAVARALKSDIAELTLRVDPYSLPAPKQGEMRTVALPNAASDSRVFPMAAKGSGRDEEDEFEDDVGEEGGSRSRASKAAAAVALREVDQMKAPPAVKAGWTSRTVSDSTFQFTYFDPATCMQAEKKAGRRMWYALHYRLMSHTAQDSEQMLAALTT